MHSSRRTFIAASAATAVSMTRAVGANGRIRVGIIGNGHRGVYVMRGFMAHPECQVVAVCDVYRPKAMKAAEMAGASPDIYTDYRRVLDRSDIDAVLVATPDHWHAPMTVEACKAGKDVYVEKPLSNTIEGCQRMIAAGKEYRRVIQVGLQQRSIEHFQECAKMLQGGVLGRVSHVTIVQPGSYGSNKDVATEPPADFDWEMFQGPAPRKPYTVNRQNRWRGYWDYGGGLITDWGVHWTDVAHWFSGDDRPRSATASWRYAAFDNPEMVPDHFILSWKYDSYLMTFMNYDPPSTPARFMSGITFHGERGNMLVNRMGYILTPKRGRQGDVFEAKDYLPPRELIPLNVEAKDHVANFIECMKTRGKPVVDVETGFRSTLPTLLGLLAIRQNRVVGWDGEKAV